MCMTFLFLWNIVCLKPDWNTLKRNTLMFKVCTLYAKYMHQVRTCRLSAHFYIIHDWVCKITAQMVCIKFESAGLMHTFYYYTPGKSSSVQSICTMHKVCADAKHLHIMCSCILIAHYLVIIVGCAECLHMQTLHTFSTLLFLYIIKIFLKCAFSLHFVRKSKYAFSLHWMCRLKVCTKC